MKVKYYLLKSGVVMNKIKVFSKTLGNKKISLQCIGSLSKQAEFLLSLIEIEYKSINVLQDNYKIQIGWSIYIISGQNEEFVILSPDYNQNPFKDMKSDLTIPLMIQAQQNEMLRKTKVQSEPVSFQDTMVILKDALKSDLLYLERKEICKKGDSGWYLGLLDDKNEARGIEDYQSIYIFQLLQLKPALLQLLTLPVGCIAIIDGDSIVEVVDNEDNRIL